MKKKRIYFTLFILAILTPIVFTCWANITIENESRDFIVSDINKLTPAKTGLLLGANKMLRAGGQNDYFYYRIDAAAELYKHKKIKYLIVSGDNTTPHYNEPMDMRAELLKRGVPDSVIYMDFAGIRTFDSVIRAKEIFGQNNFIIISQQFHNERAVFIARENNINAYAFNAKDVTSAKGFKTKIREVFARDKVFLDMLFGVTPKYLGDKVKIE